MANQAGAASDTDDDANDRDVNEVKRNVVAATPKEDQLLEDAVIYVKDKKYPDDADSDRKRKKAQKLSVDNGEIKCMMAR